MVDSMVGFCCCCARASQLQLAAVQPSGRLFKSDVHDAWSAKAHNHYTYEKCTVICVVCWVGFVADPCYLLGFCTVCLVEGVQLCSVPSQGAC